MTRTDTFGSDTFGSDRPQDHLDFPGAETLMAAGRVAPPKAETVAAAQAVVRAAIERDAEVAALTPAAGTPPPAPRRPRAPPPRGLRRAVLPPPRRGHGAGRGRCRRGHRLPGPHRDRQRTVAAPRAVSAKAFLNDMAQVAAATPATKAPYWKTSLTVTVPADGEKERTHTRYLDRKGKSTEVNPDGSTQVTLTARAYAVGDRTLGWNQLDKLPTDPRPSPRCCPPPTPPTARPRAPSTTPPPSSASPRRAPTCAPRSTASWPASPASRSPAPPRTPPAARARPWSGPPTPAPSA
ncbi:hypothetical protein SAZ11_35410 [Streptomyces sp. FXJ1.4098]|nr:hypothetical protein [Streptomyces sp. FXJ1.4098]